MIKLNKYMVVDFEVDEGFVYYKINNGNSSLRGMEILVIVGGKVRCIGKITHNDAYEITKSFDVEYPEGRIQVFVNDVVYIVECEEDELLAKLI